MSREMGRREFLKQGSLAGMVATAGLGGTWPVARRQTGEPMIEGRQLDSHEFILSIYDRTPRQMTFTAATLEGARQWQSGLRARLTERLGGFPSDRVELRPEVLERRDLGAYTRERVVFQTREDLSAIGYLLLPKKAPRPLRAVLCLPGHGRGADDIVGIAEDGTQRTSLSTDYSKDFAIQVVQHGYAAFALEQLCFGARRDALARAKGPDAYSCLPTATAALLFGQTMIGWRAWDAMRAIDYLTSRPEIDPDRIATMGISGGGTTSFFTAALDERVDVCVVSGYFNTFRDCIVSLSHCPDNYVPHLLDDIEMYDLAGLVAPRALFVESGLKDPIFPIAGSREAFEKARVIYDVFGVPDQLGREIHDGAHEFHGVGAFEFLGKRA